VIPPVFLWAFDYSLGDADRGRHIPSDALPGDIVGDWGGLLSHPAGSTRGGGGTREGGGKGRLMLMLALGEGGKIAPPEPAVAVAIRAYAGDVGADEGDGGGDVRGALFADTELCFSAADRDENMMNEADRLFG